MVLCVVIMLAAAPSTAVADTVAPADEGALTPERAMALALANHPRLLEQRERRNEFLALEGQARATALPTLTASASVVRSRDPGLLNSPQFNVEDFDSDGTGFLGGFDPSPIPVTAYDYRVSVDQTLYAFGRIGAAIQSAREQERQIDEEIRAVEIEVARDAVVALFGLALAGENVEVLAAEREALESQVKQAEDFLEIGTGTRLQYLQAKTALTNLKPREIEAQGRVEAARVALAEALGLPPMTDLDPLPGLLTARSLPELPSTDLLIAATGERPDLRAMQYERASLAEQGKVWRSNTLPDITFSGTYGINSIFSNELTNMEFSSWNAGVFFEWSFFDGLETRNKLREVRSRVAQNEFRERSMRAQYERDLIDAVVEFRRAREAAAAAAVGVSEAEETLRIAQESYQWGAATSLDILQAQQALTSARFQTVRATHDALVAYVQIVALTGRYPLETLMEAQP